MKHSRSEDSFIFIKKPQPDDIIKVYGFDKKVKYGKVIDVQVRNNGLQEREVAILKPISYIPNINKCNFFLDERKVIFLKK